MRQGDEETQADLARMDAWLRESEALLGAVTHYCDAYGQGGEWRRLEALTREMAKDLGVLRNYVAEQVQARDMAQSLEVILEVLAEEVRDRAERC